MILLRFTVRNHKSIRDETTIDLTRSSLKTLQPRDGDWASATYPLAGIFGGNATGKSAILDAMLYAFSAIRSSSTVWQQERAMPRAPFALDSGSRAASSRYEFDLVHESRRYQYGFEVGQAGVVAEWLRDIPSTRWRRLLDRDRETGSLYFHQSLGGRIAVSARELVLSRALTLGDEHLGIFAARLGEQFDIVQVKDSHREARLASIADSLADGDITFPDLEALLRVADIGIAKVELEESKIPGRILSVLQRAMYDLNQPSDDEKSLEQGASDVDRQEDLEEGERELVVRHMLFTHQAVGADNPRFSLGEESDGTIAWLALAVPALERLRRGGLLLVDEIDASLHPHLVDLLLGVFADSDINTRHAQMVFTSHESYVLSPLSDVHLEPEQIWFTDKTYDGATELACLEDFPKHPDANVAKRYLTGRYGGIPRLSPSTFAGLVQAGEGER